MRSPVTLCMFFVLSMCCFKAVNAQSSAPTQCFAGGEDPHQLIYFFDHRLGFYDVHLQPALNAIRHGSSASDLYKKSWYGPVPGTHMCDKGDCWEFTVYPKRSNFTSVTNPNSNIMDDIHKYTGNQDNRGTVRIITNHDMTKYVYTTDHEQTFCAPMTL